MAISKSIFKAGHERKWNEEEEAEEADAAAADADPYLLFFPLQTAQNDRYTSS